LQFSINLKKYSFFRISNTSKRVNQTNIFSGGHRNAKMSFCSIFTFGMSLCLLSIRKSSLDLS